MFQFYFCSAAASFHFTEVELGECYGGLLQVKASQNNKCPTVVSIYLQLASHILLENDNSI